jgi:ribosomal protein S18 acetylase RimI-like enzyme
VSALATRIRPATAADADFVAWVILTASRSQLPIGAWDHYVDADEASVLAFLHRMVTQDVPSFCQWDGFLVAEVDGVPAAGLSGYASSEPAMANPEPALIAASRAFGWTEAQHLAAGARLGAFLTCVIEPPPDTWIVEWVATRPAFRRRGLVHELLLAILDAGRRRGFARSQIMVFVGNTAARCAYERAGFVFTDDTRHPDFERLMGCPGIERLLRDL